MAELVRRARAICAPLFCSVSGSKEDGKGFCLWEPALTGRLAKMGKTLADSWNVAPELVAGL